MEFASAQLRGQTVDATSVLDPEFALRLGRQVCRERRQGLDPAAVAGCQERHGPFAAKQHAIFAEYLECVTDVGRQVIDRPALMVCFGCHAADFARHIR